MNYLHHATSKPTQTEQAHPSQVLNSAGGYTFAIDDWQRLKRFLVLGSEGGTYYASERKLTLENAAVIDRLIQADGPRLVEEIAMLSESGRAPKNDPAILALAMAAKKGNDATRAAAYAALPRVCRIGTHLYHFASFANELGGWGRGLRRAMANWFKRDDLAYQLAKYQQRDGWSARDLLRLSHAKPVGDVQGALFCWATQGYDGAAQADKVKHLPPLIEAIEELKTATDEARVCRLVREYRVPREAIPTEWLTKPAVWEAMLPHLGLTTLVRNLATMTRIGLIAPLGVHNAAIAERVSNADALKKAHVHPIQTLSALKTYAQGHGERGSSTWNPVQQIVDALDAGFYASFGAIEPTGKSTLLAIDVSGSMCSGTIAGVPGLTPRMAAAAMALVTANIEKNYAFMGFSHTFVNLPISPRMRLDEVMRVMDGLPFASTDCSLPFVWAKEMRAKVESFAVYTDNETYAGRVHPHTALQAYRQASGLAARSVVVGMTATQFTVADPSDAGMMDVVGFDAATPQILSDFYLAR